MCPTTAWARLVAVVLAVLLLVGSGIGIAAAEVAVTGIDAPSSAPSGKTVTVTASGVSDEATTEPVTIALFRMDTKEKLCETSGTSPAELSCQARLTVPAEDLRLRAYIQFGGRIVDDEYTTITVTAARDDPMPTPTPTKTGTETPPPTPTTTTATNTTATPRSLGEGGIQERGLPDDYTVNNSSGLIEATDGATTGTDTGAPASEDDDSLLGDVIGGLTDTARDGFVSVLTE